MFAKSSEYDPGVDGRYAEGISSLLERGGRLYAGREDGVVECIGVERYCHTAFAPEFDFLENDTIREKIVAVEQTTDGGVHDILFLGNEKSLRVLRMRSDSATLSICHGSTAHRGFRVTEEKHVPNVHSYITNSLSLSAGGDALISADFLRINMWRPERMEQFFSLVDLKPQVHGCGLSFVINAAKFSPFSDSLIAFSASNGDVSLHDLDAAPRSQLVSSMRNAAANGVRSVSDFSFVDDFMLVTRSLNNVALFDLRKPSSPVLSLDLVTAPSEQALLNSSSAVYQTFKISNDGMHAYTGSCFNTVYCVNLLSGDVLETTVGSSRTYDISNRIRLVVRDGTGFACVFGGRLYRFSMAAENK